MRERGMNDGLFFMANFTNFHVLCSQNLEATQMSISKRMSIYVVLDALGKQHNYPIEHYSTIKGNELLVSSTRVGLKTVPLNKRSQAQRTHICASMSMRF